MKQILGIFLLFILNFQPLFAYTEAEIFAANKLASQEIIAKQENPQDYRLADNITRKEFMKVVANITGENIEESCENNFQDVENDWGCRYIEWALNKGFIAKNNNFRPNENITKAESMKLILKARGIMRIQNTDNWRIDDMMTAYLSGIIQNQYQDFDTQATRGWIFETSATDTNTYIPGVTPSPNDPNLVP